MSANDKNEPFEPPVGVHGDFVYAGEDGRKADKAIFHGILNHPDAVRESARQAVSDAVERGMSELGARALYGDD